MLNETPLITAEDMLHLLKQNNPSVTVFDCRFRFADIGRGKRQFEEGHIPGALYAHLNDDLSDMAAPPAEGRHPLPAPEVFCQWLSQQGASPRSIFIVYDDAGGTIAARLWWMLRAQDATDVRVLDGGLPAWIEAGGVLEKGASTRTGSECDGRPASEPRNHPWPLCRGGGGGPPPRDNVVRAAPLGKLVDARDPRRFAGIEEPIDRVAGHIPGAKNLPFSEFLRPDNHLHTGPDLAAIWQAVAEDPADSIVYCGSGVTACHLILTAVAAGLGEPRLFAPSWSGWIAPSEQVLNGP